MARTVANMGRPAVSAKPQIGRKVGINSDIPKGDKIMDLGPNHPQRLPV